MADFFSTASISGWDLLFALLSIVGTWVLSIFAKRGVLTLTSRFEGLSPEFRITTARVVKYAIIVFGIAVALSFLGAQLQPLLVVAIIIGVIVALTLRGISDNFAAGIVLQTRRPIHIGDVIEHDDRTGIVRELNSRTVIMTTFDGMTVHIPNSRLMQDSIVNHSAGGAVRSSVQVRAELADVDPSALAEAVLDAVRGANGVLAQPGPAALFVSISGDRVTLDVQFWHDPAQARATTSAVVVAIDTEARANGRLLTVTSDNPAAPLSPPFEH